MYLFLFISPIKKFKYYKIELVFMIYLVMSVCAYDIDAVSISMLLWIVMPILLSISVTNYFEYKGFLLHEAMRTMLILLQYIVVLPSVIIFVSRDYLLFHM